MKRIVQFAIATSMRLDETCRVKWCDLDIDRRILLIRDRKDPRNNAGNNKRIRCSQPPALAVGRWSWRRPSTSGLRRDRSFPTS